MSTDTVRLHISPLTPETYPIVVPASLHSSVSDLSYHKLPNFPEKNYGFVQLPVAEAERLKKRIHGALVKGAKIKVEAAKPKRSIDYTGHPADIEQIGQSSHPRQADAEGVLRGIQLPDTRRVRRGWTEPAMARKERKDKKSESGGTTKKASFVEKSKYTDQEELLFKAAKVKTEPGTDAGKKRKRGEDTMIVHEFKQTTKFPNFLRGQAADKSNATTEYDVEKGWVDKDGKVVEGPRRSRRKLSESAAGPETSNAETHEVTKAAKKLSIQPKSKPALNVSVEQDEETSSSGSSDEDEEDDDESDEQTGSDSDLASEVEGDAEPEPKLNLETAPKTDVSVPSLEVQPVSAASENAGEVHPLEALFKRPKSSGKKPPGLELKIPQAFSFFGGNDGDESEDGDIPTALPTLPQTPFTQADLRFRRERSAAPTPDTAAPTKLLFGPVMDKPLPTATAEEDEEDDSDDEADIDAPEDAGPDTKKGRSEFAEKVFWEKRGDNNRAWKKRRREVSKQKRYEGNKRRTRSTAT